MAGSIRLILLALLLAARLAALDVVFDSDHLVIDQAGVVSAAQRQRIENVLTQLWRRDLAQAKVLTIASTGGEDFFSFVQRQAERSRLGRAGKDQGVLIALAVADHEARIQVGKGLEGALPDSWCGTLLRVARERYFRSGAYGEGLVFITEAVGEQVAAEAGTKLEGVTAVAPRQPPSAPAWPMIIFIGVLLVMVFINRRRRRSGLWPGVFGGFGGFGGGGWGGGGSFGGGFGGGGGGFGGGGGSFGGGGAGTRW
jgi:uncharacterized protein